MKGQRNAMTLYERQSIHVMKSKGGGIREISRHVKRSPSVVFRELQKRHPFPGVWRCMTRLERAKWSHDEAKRRRARKYTKYRLKTPEVRSYVIGKLREEDWSPEEISAKLPQEQAGASISARAIYSFIREERPDLSVCLPERGKSRRRGGGTRTRKKRKSSGPEKRSIEQRPLSVEKRIVVGDWEGDTIVSCRGGKGGILSLVERATRFGFYQLLPDLKSETVLSVLRAFFERIPQHLRRSLTLDNGGEFEYSALIKLEKAVSLPIYYCHPYCSQERGTVERRNRNIRWYFPKGTDFQNVGKRELQNAVQKIHNRPMKCLEYSSSQQVWNENLRIPQNHKVAA